MDAVKTQGVHPSWKRMPRQVATEFRSEVLLQHLMEDSVFQMGAVSLGPSESFEGLSWFVSFVDPK